MYYVPSSVNACTKIMPRPKGGVPFIGVPKFAHVCLCARWKSQAYSIDLSASRLHHGVLCKLTNGIFDLIL